MAGETIAVRCRGLTKSFGVGEEEFWALRGVNLDIYAGELLMLVGPSGCGKTTLISVVAGILDRTGGDCRVLGVDFRNLSKAKTTAWRGRHVGFVFQAFNLIPALTAADNVAVPLSILGVGHGEAIHRAARAAVEQTRTDLERIVIRAPVAGEILQINTREGEYINNFGNSPPPVIMGDTTILHVRTDIDENDAWRLDPTAPARATTLRGNAEIGTPLTFVRLEPYVIPKVNLTGMSSERVDTRVLRVLYSFPKNDLPVFAGQQMDVFIEAK